MIMEKNELLKYFVYFDGTEECPFGNETKEAEIWGAERFIWNYPDIIDNTSPKVSVRNYVEAFVGKWDPWGCADIMKHYDLKIK